MPTAAIQLFEPAYDPEPAIPWLPTLGWVFAATLTAVLVCPEPLARPLTPVMAAWQALLVVALAGGVAAASARVFFSNFSTASPDDARTSSWLCAADGLWFAPAVIFVAQKQPWSIPAGGLLGLAAARLLLRLSASPEGAPSSASPTLGSSAGMARAFAATLAVEAGVLAQVNDRSALAALLAGAACFVVAAYVPPGALPKTTPTEGRLRTNFVLQAVGAVTLATLALIRIAGFPVPTVRAGVHGDGSSSRGGMGDPDLLSGAILLADVSPQAKLTLPVSPHSAPITPRRAAPHASIEFSGEYWILFTPMRRPPKISMIVRATPVTFAFSATDRSALFMSAHQRLKAPIDPRCCSAIEMTVRNADPQPETIELRMALTNFGIRRGASQPLGGQRLSAGEISILSFPIPAQPAISQFDEITVEFDLGSRRLHRSAKVAIQSFAFVPRIR